MQDHLDEQDARFFFACRIPFALVERPEFRQLVSNLRPGYTVPNWNTLGSTLLDKVHDSINNAAEKSLQCIQDGWSDVYSSPVIAQVCCCGVHCGQKRTSYHAWSQTRKLSIAKLLAWHSFLINFLSFCTAILKTSSPQAMEFRPRFGLFGRRSHLLTQIKRAQDSVSWTWFCSSKFQALVTLCTCSP